MRQAAILAASAIEADEGRLLLDGDGGGGGWNCDVGGGGGDAALGRIERCYLRAV